MATNKIYNNDDFADFDQRLKDIENEINGYPIWLLGKSTVIILPHEWGSF